MQRPFTSERGLSKSVSIAALFFGVETVTAAFAFGGRYFGEIGVGWGAPFGFSCVEHFCVVGVCVCV